jgi:hypothetical protein
MGYMFVLGNCFACHRPFTFNATWVPSIMVEGTRHPVCANCMAAANAERVAMGLEPHPINPNAYEPEEAV